MKKKYNGKFIINVSQIKILYIQQKYTLTQTTKAFAFRNNLNLMEK